jgi:hypothetical protein
MATKGKLKTRIRERAEARRAGKPAQPKAAAEVKRAVEARKKS